MTASEEEAFTPWSVVTVPFPFTDKNRQKKRPALVLSSEHFHSNTGHLTLCMITSAKNSSWYNDTKISGLKSAGLPCPSVVRMKIFTLDSGLIVSTIGRLTARDKSLVNKKLNALLGD